MKNLCLMAACALFAPCAAKASMQVDQPDRRVTVQSAHFALVIDLSKGGEVTDLRLHDGSSWNALLAESTLPALAFHGPSGSYVLANDAKATLTLLERRPEAVVVETRGFACTAEGAPSPIGVTLRYEIYEEGAVFIDFACVLAEGAVSLTRADLSLVPSKSVAGAARFRDDVFGKAGGGFPSGRIAFGMNPDKSFTNEVEMLVERRTPFLGVSDYEHEKGWSRWVLGASEAPVQIAAPFEYRNRVAVALGAAIAGKPRSNVIGQRVYHWVNRLDRENWYPTNEQIDSMVNLHATMLILHQDWMLQSGSNGNPHADYRVARDHDDMVRMFDYAHSKGLRVGLYMRGIETYGLATGFFQKYCRRDWDGIYTDWHGPLARSWHEQRYKPETQLDDTHFSEDGSYTPAREYFLFTRRQREIVGPDGFLIGHQGSFSAGIFANLCFDAYLPGETGSDRKILSTRDEAVYKGMLGGCVCMPWTLDLPLYRSAEGAAKMAAWGFYPHLVAGIQSRQNENVTFSLDAADDEYAFVQPYWRVLAAIDVGKATVFNLPSHNVTAARFSNSAFAGLVYKVDPARYLVVAANLGQNEGQSDIELDAAVLGLDGEYQVERIDSTDGRISPGGLTAGRLSTSVLPQWGIEGFRLTRP